MRRIFWALLLLFLTTPYILFGLDANRDSLRAVIASNPAEEEFIDAIVELAASFKYESPDSVLKYATIGASTARKADDNEGLARCLILNSWVHRTRGEYAESIAIALQALHAAENVPGTPYLADALFEVGVIHFEQGEYKAADSAFQNSLEIAEALGYDRGAGYAINHLGEVKRKLGNHAAALGFYFRARDLFAKIDYPNGINIELNNIGLVYLATNQYDSALHYLTRSIELGEKLQFRGIIMESSDALAKTYLGLKDFDQAKKHAIANLEYAESHNFKKYMREANYTLAKTYEATGHYEDAYTYMETYDRLRAEISNDEIRKRIANLNHAYQLQRKQLQIEAHANEIALLNKTKEVNRIVTIGLTVGMGFLFFFGFVLYRAYRQNKKNNAILSEKNEILEDLNHEKDMLMNIVAHDLQSPLNKVRGLSDLLNLTGELDEEQEDYVNKIRAISEEGSKLIRDLLDINAVEGKNSQLELMEFDAVELIREVLLSFEIPANEKQIQLQYAANGNQIMLKSDRTFIARILDNLLSNALKFSEPGKKITVESMTAGGGLRFTVKDEGPGFSIADRNRMFRKFQRLSAKPTAGESSNGLGLAIIKTLVDKLGGTIDLDSEPGKGARFIVSLPNLAGSTN